MIEANWQQESLLLIHTRLGSLTMKSHLNFTLIPIMLLWFPHVSPFGHKLVTIQKRREQSFFSLCLINLTTLNSLQKSS